MLATLSLVSFITLSQSVTVQTSLRAAAPVYQPSFSLAEASADKGLFDKVKKVAKS